MANDIKWYDPPMLVFYGIAGGIAVGAGYIIYEGIKELPARYAALLNPKDEPLQAKQNVGEKRTDLLLRRRRG